jgi:DNA repair photolyase
MQKVFKLNDKGGKARWKKTALYCQGAEIFHEAECFNGGTKMNNPIYKPKGAAKEYGDLAINIYTGCNHGCTYCFAPALLRKNREDFEKVKLRKDIVESVKKQIEREQIMGKMIHLCFICDPYPADIDTMPTREIIRIIKKSGNYVQILTKGGFRAERDFDLLDDNDNFGVTFAGYSALDFFGANDIEPKADAPISRLASLQTAHRKGIKTWVSCEPVLTARSIYDLIVIPDYIDSYKIGKLNYHSSDINWKEFGNECERLCNQYNRQYVIKDGLRKEMEK